MSDDPLELSELSLARWRALAAALHGDGVSVEQFADWARTATMVLPSGPRHTLVDLFGDDEAPRVTPEFGGGRYADDGLLGAGGMGEVRRVFDRRLNRSVAMKRLHPSLRDAGSVHRFLGEAQATAQLQHPGVVPTYDLGSLEDGQPYFTMKEVDGVTLADLIDHVHQGGEGWTVTRLVDVFRRVCEAVAYAHDRGVMHRDLKPSNVMVGAYGEVLVMDWGLAKVVGADEQAVVTDRSRTGTLHTRVGAVIGTPAYLAPEGFDGPLATPPGDVYALGCVLFEILTGRLAFEEPDLDALIVEKRRGAWPDPSGAGVPEDLARLCRAALHPDPAGRPPDAAGLGAEVGRWLDGATRRERARATLHDALALRPRAEQLRRTAAERARAAEATLADVPSWAPVADKLAGWRLQDEAEAAVAEAERLTVQLVQQLRTALSEDPLLDEAHAALAEHFHAEHAAAEAAGDTRAAAVAEASLRHHDRGAHAAWLQGDGTLSLETSIPGAEVSLWRYRLVERRRVPVFERSLGVTPLTAVPVGRGDALLVLSHPDAELVRLPLHVGRGEHVVAGEIGLPPVGGLGADDVYVPSGWAWVGGDADAMGPLPRRRVWVDGFVIQRHPVTCAEWLVFLDDLVAQGREAEALAAAPRERGGAGQPGALLVGRDADGRFVLHADADGDAWQADWPVVMVDWPSAVAYAAWKAEREGLAWRLPGEIEREKAARGADGRRFPWGDAFDSAFAVARTSHAGRWMIQPVSAFPLDESVYGVRGLAGNVNDWCADAWTPDGGLRDGEIYRPPAADLGDGRPRVHRGGWWSGTDRAARSASRLSSDPAVRTFFLGVRLVRSVG